MPYSKEEISNILKKHQNKNFVQRILNPGISPVIRNPDKTISTHRMAVSEADGKYYVYPTIQYDKVEGLRQFNDRDAFNRALDTSEFIVFDDFQKALDFSKEYKKVWE